MVKSTGKFRQALERLERDRRALLDELLSLGDLAVGSVSRVAKKCGKPSCHCVDGEGHPHTIFAFKGDDGKRRCKLVRLADTERLLTAGDNYKSFRQTMRQLRDLNQQESEILVGLMKAKAIEYE